MKRDTISEFVCGGGDFGEMFQKTHVNFVKTLIK